MTLYRHWRGYTRPHHSYAWVDFRKTNLSWFSPVQLFQLSLADRTSKTGLLIVWMLQAITTSCTVTLAPQANGAVPSLCILVKCDDKLTLNNIRNMLFQWEYSIQVFIVWKAIDMKCILYMSISQIDSHFLSFTFLLFKAYLKL